jgi:hypothetical protein
LDISKWEIRLNVRDSQPFPISEFNFGVPINEKHNRNQGQNKFGYHYRSTAGSKKVYSSFLFTQKNNLKY